MYRIIRYLLAGLLGVALCWVPVLAQQTHPHYLRALSDLQSAYALLQVPDQPNITADQKKVMKVVGDAIGDCKHAAWWAERTTQPVPPPQVASDRPGRLHQIHGMLMSALADLQAESVSNKSNNWRDKAMGHVTEALGDLQQLFMDAHIDFNENM